MYGLVHYENETGEIRTVECQTAAEYEAEIAAGCRWVEDEPRQFRNLYTTIADEKLEAHCPDCRTRLNAEGECAKRSMLPVLGRHEGMRTRCQNCASTGIDPGSLRKPEPCPRCNGEGSVFASMRRDEAISLWYQIEERRMHREAFGV